MPTLIIKNVNFDILEEQRQILNSILWRVNRFDKCNPISKEEARILGGIGNMLDKWSDNWIKERGNMFDKWSDNRSKKKDPIMDDMILKIYKILMAEREGD